MRKLLLFSLTALLLVACKKEKQIENNLWKGGGKWEIVTVEYKYTSSLGESESEVMLNMGEMHFNKDGTGKIIAVDGNLTETLPFNYNLISETKLIVDIIDLDAIAFDIVWKKNNISMSFVETGSDFDYNTGEYYDYKYLNTWTLKKKK